MMSYLELLAHSPHPQDLLDAVKSAEMEAGRLASIALEIYGSAAQSSTFWAGAHRAVLSPSASGARCEGEK